MLRKQKNTDTSTMTYAHTISHYFSTSVINLGSPMLPVPEAGDFLELILL